MKFTPGHPDLVPSQARERAALAISRAKKGVPLSAANRAALQPYWQSKKGKPSTKRNGRFFPCTQCTRLVYKNQRDIKKSKNLFCSRPCAYRYKDQGLTSFRKKFQKSPAYQQWRRHVFQRDDYTCQRCKHRGGRLHADHDLPFALFPDLRLEILNGRTLCVPCHQLTPTYGARALQFNNLGIASLTAQPA